MTKLRCTFILFLLVSLSIFPSFGQDSGNLTQPKDWLGTYPVYGFSPYHPYYDYHQLPYIPPGYVNPLYDYAAPYYSYDPYWRFAYSWLYSDFRMSYPWWVGEHRGMKKTLDIARGHSSVRIYWGGSWQPP